jgi:uncharacterized membrane protein YciS (DUF1049 family)
MGMKKKIFSFVLVLVMAALPVVFGADEVNAIKYNVIKKACEENLKGKLTIGTNGWNCTPGSIAIISNGNLKANFDRSCKDTFKGKVSADTGKYTCKGGIFSGGINGSEYVISAGKTSTGSGTADTAIENDKRAQNGTSNSSSSSKSVSVSKTPDSDEDDSEDAKTITVNREPRDTNHCGGVETSFISCDDVAEDGPAVFRLLSIVLNVVTYGVGAAAVLGVVITGYQYITARDNNVAQVAKAKNRMLQIVIGLAIWIVFWGVLQFLLPGGLFGNGQ